MNNKRLGFTLIELLVVITIISILSTAGALNFQASRRQARDVERQADLRNLQSALELYKQKYNRYPAGCNAAGTWSGQASANTYDCPSDSTQYIIGLAPEFIPVLPTDPRLNGADSGYVYTTNAAGTVYKLMARKTVESEVVTYAHEFKSCDVANSGFNICNEGIVSGTKPPPCEETNAIFQTSYAVWGGYAAGTSDAFVEQYTEDIICYIP